jgi:hypothetical protein
MIAKVGMPMTRRKMMRIIFQPRLSYTHQPIHAVPSARTLDPRILAPIPS